MSSEVEKPPSASISGGCTPVWDFLTVAQMQYFDRPDVRRAVHGHGVVPLLADWTNQPGDIIEYMESVGLVAVPLVVIYPRESAVAPIVLSGAFDTEQLVAAIEAAAR